MITIAYCRDCGNPDCPNVSPAPYFKRCPALARLDVPVTANGAAEHDAPDPSWGPGDPGYDALPEAFPGVEGGVFMPGVRGQP